MDTFSIIPPPQVSDTVVEPYSTAMSLHQWGEHAVECMFLDNNVVYDIHSRTLKMCRRSPGQLNCDFREIVINLVPFHCFHFFAIGFTPLSICGSP